MSTYSTNLALELIGTGEQAGTWGNTTNTNLGTLIEQAISGYVTQAVSTGTDTTITIPNGATGVARNMFIELTGTGGTNTNLIVPANKKLYFIYNNASGAVTVKVSGQTGVSVAAGAKVILVSNGTDIVTATSYTASGGDVTFSSLTLSGGTANGVLYLNASKVVTSGSALTFDGTTLANTKTSVAAATELLNINRDNSGTFIKLVRNAGSGNTGGLIGADSVGTYFAGSTTANMLYVDTTNTNLQFYVNSAEGMRLTSTGLGIGTTSPADKLHVTGTIRFGANATYYGTIAHDAGVTGTNIYNSIDNGGHLFQNNTSTVLTLNGSGNLGLGVTPSAWNNAFKAFQIGAAGSVHSPTSDNSLRLSYNLYYDGAAYRRITASAASYYLFNSDSSFSWLQAGSSTASSTISFTTAMTLDASGNLGVSGVISDIAGNVRNVPSAGTTKTSAYTLAITDIGEFVTVGTSGSIVVPNDVFAAGNAVSLYNDTTGNVTVSLTITTAYIAGTNTDKASVTLATRGLATILFINPSLCVVTGNVT